MSTSASTSTRKRRNYKEPSDFEDEVESGREVEKRKRRKNEGKGKEHTSRRLDVDEDAEFVPTKKASKSKGKGKGRGKLKAKGERKAKSKGVIELSDSDAEERAGGLDGEEEGHGGRDTLNDGVEVEDEDEDANNVEEDLNHGGGGCDSNDGDDDEDDDEDDGSRGGFQDGYHDANANANDDDDGGSNNDNDNEDEDDDGAPLRLLPLFEDSLKRTVDDEETSKSDKLRAQALLRKLGANDDAYVTMHVVELDKLRTKKEAHANVGVRAAGERLKEVRLMTREWLFLPLLGNGALGGKVAERAMWEILRRMEVEMKAETEALADEGKPGTDKKPAKGDKRTGGGYEGVLAGMRKDLVKKSKIRVSEKMTKAYDQILFDDPLSKVRDTWQRYFTFEGGQLASSKSMVRPSSLEEVESAEVVLARLKGASGAMTVETAKTRAKLENSLIHKRIHRSEPAKSLDPTQTLKDLQEREVSPKPISTLAIARINPSKTVEDLMELLVVDLNDVDIVTVSPTGRGSKAASSSSFLHDIHDDDDDHSAGFRKGTMGTKRTYNAGDTFWWGTDGTKVKAARESAMQVGADRVVRNLFDVMQEVYEGRKEAMPWKAGMEKVPLVLTMGEFFERTKQTGQEHMDDLAKKFDIDIPAVTRDEEDEARRMARVVELAEAMMKDGCEGLVEATSCCLSNVILSPPMIDWVDDYTSLDLKGTTTLRTILRTPKKEGDSIEELADYTAVLDPWGGSFSQLHKEEFSLSSTSTMVYGGEEGWGARVYFTLKDALDKRKALMEAVRSLEGSLPYKESLKTYYDRKDHLVGWEGPFTRSDIDKEDLPCEHVWEHHQNVVSPFDLADSEERKWTVIVQQPGTNVFVRSEVPYFVWNYGPSLVINRKVVGITEIDKVASAKRRCECSFGEKGGWRELPLYELKTQ